MSDFSKPHHLQVGTFSVSLGHYLDRIKNSLAGRYGVHFYISRLNPYNLMPEHLKRITFNLRSAIGYMSPDADIFSLKNKDYLLIVNDISFINLERIILRFKKTFLQDPLFQEGMVVESFYRIYDLGKEGPEFYRLAHYIGEDSQNSSMWPNFNEEELSISNLTIKSGIDSKTLSILQNILTQVNAINYLRRQPICWLDATLTPKPIYYQYFLSISLLQETLKVKTQLSDNIWFFKHLASIFDQMMINLTKDLLGSKGSQSIFLNLSLRTTATPLFYDYLKKFYKQKELTIEIDILDILAHYDAYLFACEQIEKYDHRICIKGVNLLNYPLLSPEFIGNNRLKISAVPAIESDANFRNWIQKINPEKIILHNCETKTTIKEGLKYNIQFFQGFAVDDLLKP